MAARPRVLVIGAGFGGVAVAIKLAAAGSVDVTLVDRKEYFEVVFANARTLVEPALADKSVIAVADLKPTGSFVRGEVVELADDSATLADGRRLPFEFAVVAAGSGQAWGKGAAATAAERRAEIRAEHQALRAAPAMVVVGGGSLGVEIAGEVVTEFPDKPTYLIHSGQKLMQSIPGRASSLALSWLRRHGCKVLLGQRLVDAAAGANGSAAAVNGSKSNASAAPKAAAAGRSQLVTSGGVALPEGAMVLWATGTRPSTGFMRRQLADALDGDGLIRVLPTLQVVGHPSLFALGDACDVKEEKLAYIAKLHADVVADNVARLAAATRPGGASDGTNGAGQAAVVGQVPELAEWKPGMGLPTIMIVSLGRRWAIAHLAYITVGGWLFSVVKSIDRFVAAQRRDVCRVP